jgi:hypothetical protein
MAEQKIEKPEKPLPSDCCGGGACCPCVWDDYFEKLRLWQEQQGESDSKSMSIEQSDEKWR